MDEVRKLVKTTQDMCARCLYAVETTIWGIGRVYTRTSSLGIQKECSSKALKRSTSESRDGWWVKTCHRTKQAGMAKKKLSKMPDYAASSADSFVFAFASALAASVASLDTEASTGVSSSEVSVTSTLGDSWDAIAGVSLLEMAAGSSSAAGSAPTVASSKPSAAADSAPSSTRSAGASSEVGAALSVVEAGSSSTGAGSSIGGSGTA